MFGKRRQPTSDITVLGAGTALEGKLTVRGAVQVDGAISGSLTAEGDLSVGPSGRILGEVRAATLSVRGKIHGIVVARCRLHVLSSGAVRGHARYATLQIERGGVMDGGASLIIEGQEQKQQDDNHDLSEAAE